MSAAVEPGRGASRRRGDALRNAIFDAVLEQLRTVGYAKLTVESVAAASGTGKAAIYRRWPGRQELVADALRHALPSPADVPPHDDPRDAVLALLRAMRDAFAATSGAAFQAVMAEAAFLQSIVNDQVIEPCERSIRVVLQDAVAAGRLGPRVRPELIARIGPAMLLHHGLTIGPDIPEEYLVSVVDEVILPVIGPAPSGSPAGRA
ncbi:AcrR family transcriptional regulator [Actinoplanes octamycinicus]|uniref:AcrR family transcriptional regulator n=1 Tax=Actinoplanes octamycinicus TaxID=135948 RepID=A0A7W7H1E2_9ACTN|nr:TetR/AcrR family transcriptional regulator [Actinoplanes octamycinicus]MBB4742198.1 AcrR family transcriptional regulator [Actinoplanes octamycinicus]GIE59956.1 TetR family transcriptional regulator [Actinoplanes octamycinicus]